MSITAKYRKHHPQYPAFTSNKDVGGRRAFYNNNNVSNGSNLFPAQMGRNERKLNGYVSGQSGQEHGQFRQHMEAQGLFPPEHRMN